VTAFAIAKPEVRLGDTRQFAENRGLSRHGNARPRPAPKQLKILPGLDRPRRVCELSAGRSKGKSAVGSVAIFDGVAQCDYRKSPRNQSLTRGYRKVVSSHSVLHILQRFTVDFVGELSFVNSGNHLSSLRLRRAVHPRAQQQPLLMYALLFG
jgi:hypothetical protein